MSDYMRELSEVKAAVAEGRVVLNGKTLTRLQGRKLAAVEFLLAVIDDWAASKSAGLLKISMFGTEELDLPVCGMFYAKSQNLTHESGMRILREGREILRQVQTAAWYWGDQKHNRKHAA